MFKIGRLGPESDLVDLLAVKFVGGGVDTNLNGQLHKSRREQPAARTYRWCPAGCRITSPYNDVDQRYDAAKSVSASRNYLKYNLVRSSLVEAPPYWLYLTVSETGANLEAYDAPP